MCKKLVCLISVLLVFGLAGNALAAVDVLGSWVEGTSHTKEAGSNRALLFFAYVEDDNADMNLSSVTYGGQSMTKVVERNYGTGWRIYVVAYILDENGVDAASGSTFSPTWAATPSRTPAYASVFLSGVNQADLVGASATGGGDGVTTVSTSALATANGDMAIVAAASGGTGSYTVNNNFTEGIEVAPESADGVAGYKAATGSDETPSVTHSTTKRQAIIGFVMQVAGAAPPGKATNPSPSHQATDVSITADLSWTAGSGATSHDVYFGTDSTPDETEFKGNQAGTTYDPGTMANDTTYYWRIDEVNAYGTTTGDVWSFTTVVAPPGQATNPSPSHQATDVSVDADLSWTAGSGATSHDVYFGTDSTPDETEFKVNQAGTTYEPGTLDYATTYYWRIDEVNAGGTTTGDVWSFTTTTPPPPGKATSPSPSHQATDVSVDADLSWTAGSGATSHDVYFGTDSTPDETEFKVNQAGTTYEPGTMANDTTYYWRIDEVNAGGTTTGDVWSFTTEAAAPPPPDPNLVGWWKLDESSGTTADDSSGNDNDGTVVGDVNWMPSGGQLDGAASLTGGAQRIEFSTSDMSASAGTVALWGYPEGAQTQNYRYFFAIRDLPGGGNRVQLYLYQETMQLGVGLGDNYAVNTNIMTLSTDTWYHIALTWDGGDYVVYVDANSADSGTYTGLSSMTTGGDIGNDHQDRNKGLYGRMDDVGVWDEALSAGDIENIYLYGIGGSPGTASNPSPANGATGVDPNADLSWTAGDYAADVNGHDVYFGTDYNSVADANHSSDEFKGNQTATTYDPGTMANNTTYYWAIDEVNDTHQDSPWMGDVWSFTTAAAGGPPGQASNPSPAHQATGVGINADLSWTAGSGATSHDVYFGTDSTPDATEFKGNQAGTTYEPGTMDANTAYYWRIDEVNAYGTTTGVVWSFTTTTGGGTGSGATPVAEFRVIPTSGWDIYYKPEFVSKATGDITSYEWDFGDEQTSYDRAPNHQYSSPGTYTVSLTVSGPGGSDTETKTNHITVNNFSTGYSYDDYVLTAATMTQWDDAVDDIETAGGGRILFDFTNQTIYINHHRDFYGDNLIIDGQDKNVSLYYNGPDDCSQTENQDALIRIHGDDNIFRNLDYDRFPEGISMRGGNRNLIENVTVDVICEDAMTMNGSGYECFDCIFRNCTLGASVDKAVMVNNGGRGVFSNISFTDSTQPIRCTGATGEYVIRHCNIGGSTNGLRCDGGSPGHLIYVEENTVGSGSQRGIRVYGYVDAIIRHNSFSGSGCDYGVWAFENAKVRLEHNTITGYDLDGVSVDNSVLADLGGGSVTIDGSSEASPGGNTITGSSGYDVQNNTGSGIKAEYNYWDHSTVADVEQYDVDGTVDVDPLGS